MKQRPIKIAASIACDDFRHLQDLMRRLEGLRIDYIHYDVMDGHFVPNITFGPELQARIRAMTDITIETHLMITDPDRYIERFAEAGSAIITVHAEACPHLSDTLNHIRSCRVGAGVALSPDTPVSRLKDVLELVDMVVIMTVNPGFSGQQLVPGTIEKVADARKMIDERGLDIDIQVDGNVSLANIPRMISAGANVLVAGTSSLFAKSGTLEENHAAMRKVIEEAIA